ncbi:hypothetical protein BDR07DRAFT_1437114 [Suillus spraguei]|nr:hypothetical protein BDR07DRAFT_1437114 [Suillus spraguei]
MKHMMDRLFSRSSVSQGHTSHSRRIPLTDVFVTRCRYRTPNAHSGKRHKLQELLHPRQQAHASASNSSTPPAVTSNVTGGVTSATLQTRSTSATNRPTSPLDIENVPDTSCFAVLTRCFPRFSRTRRTSPTTSRTP